MTNIMTYVSAKDVYSKEMMIHAEFYRGLALDIDRDPHNIKQYLNSPSMMAFIDHRNFSCLERTKRFECLSYGDVGVLLSAPGPSLAGQMVMELGDEEQQSLFHQYIVAHQARTFLAVTEPARGSDAANIATRISCNETENKYFLTGEKCFVGNGAVGEIGVVIARLSPGPLGMVAVIIIPGQSGIGGEFDKGLKRTTLPTVGLHGASLSHLVFNNYEIKEELILGKHLRIVNRGLMGLMKTFNRMRTCVGALAIGLSQAVLDYVCGARKNLSHREQNLLMNLSAELAVARKILYSAAMRIDEDVTDSAAASMAKAISTSLAERIVNSVLELFDPDVFWEHPLLEKWHRDAYGFEYMEGTMQIHYKNVAQRYLSDKNFISRQNEYL